MGRVHLDHNSTTPLRPEALEAWLEVVRSAPGNPSSPHAAGRRGRAWIDEARQRVAGALGVAEEEVVFTSGGTEADNHALRGAAEALGPESWVAVGATEHSAVLEPARALGAAGHGLCVLPVDRAGRPRREELEARIRAAAAAGPGVVSIALANNEVGTVVAPDEWVPLVRERAGDRTVLHSDAVQALGRVEIDLRGSGLDLASFSAHKVGGPVGVGVLWRRRGVALAPLLRGGGQESGDRAGTEDAAGIVAASVAIELAVRERAEVAARMRRLATELWGELEQRLPAARLLGPPIEHERERLPNTLAVLFPGLDGKVLVTRLDLDGLEVSAGSACASGSVEPSHVLRAMGLDEDAARSALRLSLGRETSREDCGRAVDILQKAIASMNAS